MNVKKFVKPKDHEINYQNYLFLLQNFDESCLKVTRQRAGERECSNTYLIEYQKFGEKAAFPLYFVIPHFYGCISGDIVDVFDKKYLSICCGNVVDEFKKVVEIIIEKISEIRSKEYEITSDYLKIRVGQGVTEMPVDVLMKIKWVVISFNLIVESENGLFVLNNLKECFYENLNESNKANINDDFKIIKSEK